MIKVLVWMIPPVIATLPLAAWQDQVMFGDRTHETSDNIY